MRCLAITAILITIGLTSSAALAQPAAPVGKAPAIAPQPAQPQPPVKVQPLPQPAQPPAQGKPAQPPVQVKPAAPQESFDEKVLREDKQGTDGPALLQYFKKRTYPEADPQRLEQLIQQLGDRSFKEREKASRELLTFGSSALESALREAERSLDSEIAARAGTLRRRVEEKANAQLQNAAARLLAERKPAETAEVLLAFLPYAADETVVDEISRTLAAVAVRDGKVDALLVAALKDKVALRRGPAGAALAAAAAKDQLPAIRELLKDADPNVRLRVGVALLRKKETKAITPLIELFAELTPEQLWPAEDILLRIAGEKAPAVSLGADAVGRQKCHKAWKQWWVANEKTLNIAAIDLNQAMLGYTLVVHQAANRPVVKGGMRANWQIIELDAARNKRWSFEMPTYAVDATVIKEDRVLVTEYQGAKISIRNFKGEVQFEKMVGGNPLSAQYLPNGNIFVVTQQRLVEFDADGKEVWVMQRPNSDIFRGRELRGGEVVFVTNQGDLVRMDAAGKKELHRFNVGPMGNLFGSFDVLPNGNYLVPQYQNHKVVEYDPQGQIKWQAQVQFPSTAQRLPNGHTLVCSQVHRKVMELDREGREVPNSSYTPEGTPFCARRR